MPPKKKPVKPPTIRRKLKKQPERIHGLIGVGTQYGAYRDPQGKLFMVTPREAKKLVLEKGWKRVPTDLEMRLKKYFQ